MRAPRDGGTDAPQTDDTEALAVHVDAEMRFADARLPLALPDQRGQLDSTSRGHHQQHEAGVGGGFGHRVRGIGQADAALFQVGHVVVVVTGGNGRDHLQLRRVLQHRLVELAAGADQPVGVGQGGDERLPVGAQRVEEDAQLVTLAQVGHHLGG